MDGFYCPHPNCVSCAIGIKRAEYQMKAALRAINDKIQTAIPKAP